MVTEPISASANPLTEEEERRVRRRLLAAEISIKMDAAKRTSSPDEVDAGEWVSVVDMDTNKVHWFPKDLSDEYHRLRFSDVGEP